MHRFKKSIEKSRLSPKFDDKFQLEDLKRKCLGQYSISSSEYKSTRGHELFLLACFYGNFETALYLASLDEVKKSKF